MVFRLTQRLSLRSRTSFESVWRQELQQLSLFLMEISHIPPSSILWLAAEALPEPLLK